MKKKVASLLFIALIVCSCTSESMIIIIQRDRQREAYYLKMHDDLFCNVLGIDQEVTADIMCTSRSNLRSMKSRLKSKISAEAFSLYFKE